MLQLRRLCKLPNNSRATYTTDLEMYKRIYLSSGLNRLSDQCMLMTKNLLLADYGTLACGWPETHLAAINCFPARHFTNRGSQLNVTNVVTTKKMAKLT